MYSNFNSCYFRVANRMKTTSNLLMIRPVEFRFNSETAVNNTFQSKQDTNAQELALKEFDDFVALLLQHGIDVTVIDDTIEPLTPDSIFPNNWISFHDDGSIVLYPMFAANRRSERKKRVVEKLEKRFIIRQQIDLTAYENKKLFLEGTGSMVLDRENKIAYACISQRTDVKVLDDFCSRLEFKPHIFRAIDSKGYSIYHTNVMMCVADRYVVICQESIASEIDRKKVIEEIEKSGKKIIPISFAQMNHFAGNMLQVTNTAEKKYLIMSSQAYQSLSAGQIQEIERYNSILHSSLDTIERNGGGSARCMMAEVFLPTIN